MKQVSLLSDLWNKIIGLMYVIYIVDFFSSNLVFYISVLLCSNKQVEIQNTKRLEYET